MEGGVPWRFPNASAIEKETSSGVRPSRREEWEEEGGVFFLSLFTFDTAHFGGVDGRKHALQDGVANVGKLLRDLGDMQFEEVLPVILPVRLLHDDAWRCCVCVLGKGWWGGVVRVRDDALRPGAPSHSLGQVLPCKP